MNYCLLWMSKVFNQIFLDPKEVNKITFLADMGVFAHKRMSFGLKNADSTYQCLVTGMFEKQIGNKMKVHVDNMLVKSKIRTTSSRPTRGLHYIMKTPHVTQPEEVRLRARIKQVPWFSSSGTRHKCKPG